MPVNHVLPAWDLLAGATATYALLAAERHRRETGAGQEVRVPLGDVAMATLGNLGQIAEVATSGADRERLGNTLYGSFGRDFVTADGHRLMVIAITPRQWRGLLEALALKDAVAALERELAVSFAQDDGLRFEHRDRLFPLIEAAVAQRPLAELAAAFDKRDVCWGPYRTVHQALASDPRLSAANPIFAAARPSERAALPHARRRRLLHGGGPPPAHARAAARRAHRRGYRRACSAFPTTRSPACTTRGWWPRRKPRPYHPHSGPAFGRPEYRSPRVTQNTPSHCDSIACASVAAFMVAPPGRR